MNPEETTAGASVVVARPDSTFSYHADGRPKRSQTIGKIAAALAKAQGEMEHAGKDAKNPAYGSKYATLASTWDAIREALAKHEISVYQRVLFIGDKTKLCTMLAHASGEFFDDSEVELIFDRQGGRTTPMQAMGSALTYARRYALQSAAGIASEDDDGNSSGAPQPKPAARKDPIQDAKAEIAAVADDPGEFKITFGKHKGLQLKEMDIYDLANYVAYIEKEAKEKQQPLKGQVAALMVSANAFLNSRRAGNDRIENHAASAAHA